MTKWSAALAACLLSAASVAVAQEAPKADLFAGYSYTKASAGLASAQSLHGWEASFARYFGAHVGVEIDASGHYASRNATTDISDLAFLAGPRFAIRGGALTFFVHALAGAGQTKETAHAFVEINDNKTSFAWAAGGGISIKLAGAFELRAQGDYWTLKRNDENDGNPRFAAGIAYRFR